MSHLKRLSKSIVLRAAALSAFRQSDAAVARSSARYWSGEADARFRTNSHWRDGGAFDDAGWLEIGRPHLELRDRCAAFANLNPQPRRVVEWGCGGGANAVHFATRCERFTGGDVSQATLDECGRQLAGVGESGKFSPVLAEVERPEAAIERIERCELFLCLYVLELVPSPAYAKRLLTIARELLVPGGAALVQVKYETSDPATRGRRWAYRLNLANTTTFRVEAFWSLCQSLGFEPRCCVLLPDAPLVGDERYAYYLLTRA